MCPWLSGAACSFPLRPLPSRMLLGCLFGGVECCLGCLFGGVECCLDCSFAFSTAALAVCSAVSNVALIVVQHRRTPRLILSSVGRLAASAASSESLSRSCATTRPLTNSARNFTLLLPFLNSTSTRVAYLFSVLNVHPETGLTETILRLVESFLR